MINKLAKQIHETAKAKGFYNPPPTIAEKIALIHSEVSEALEADRDNRHTPIPQVTLQAMHLVPNDHYKHQFGQNIKNTFEDELADIMIRVMDLAAYKNIDLESHIRAKMRYNTLREYKHGKKY